LGNGKDRGQVGQPTRGALKKKRGPGLTGNNVDRGFILYSELKLFDFTYLNLVLITSKRILLFKNINKICL